MKIMIAADMEGITGVTSWDHVDPTHPEYPRFRRLMTGDVNAAVRGAFSAGADQVVVSDGHHDGSNILIEELDARAVLNSGSPSPFSMVQGIDQGVDGLLFIGYHARQGSTPAICDHTWSSGRVANVWLNDLLAGEYTLNAAVAGHFGAPVLMASGDQTACAQIVAHLGKVEIAVVKRAIGRYAAECLPPSVSQQLIESAAQRGVKRLIDEMAPAPYIVQEPVKITVHFMTSDMADRAMLLPGATRDGVCVSVTSQDILEAYASFRALVTLARIK